MPAARHPTRAFAATGSSVSTSCSSPRDGSARAGSPRATTRGYGSTAGALLLARAADDDEGSVVHARSGRSESAPRALVPARRPDQGGDAGRGASRGCRRRRAARESGGVLPRRRRLPRLPRSPRPCSQGGAGARPRRSRGRAPSWALALHGRPASRPRCRLDARGRSTPSGATLPATPSSSVRARRSRNGGSRWSRGASTSRSSASRPSSGTARLRSRPASTRSRRGFRLELDEPFYGAARGQAAVLYEDDVVVGSGLISSTAHGE